MLVVNSDKLSTVQRLHRNVGWFRVNRPQLISLNGRPGLFPGTQMLLLRHLLNCSLFLPRARRPIGFLDLLALTRVELLARSFSDRSRGVRSLPAAHEHPRDPFPDPCWIHGRSNVQPGIGRSCYLGTAQQLSGHRYVSGVVTNHQPSTINHQPWQAINPI